MTINIYQKISDWLLDCPELGGYLYFNVIPLENSTASVNSNSSSSILNEYIDGSKEVRLLFYVNLVKEYDYVLIDEAQDFGEFNFKALKELLPNATFSIFGDLSQSIYQYRCINNWEQVIDYTFKNKCDIKYLLKSYRTTAEIMNQANNVIEHLGLEKAKPVIRHGEEVEYIEFDNNQIDIIENHLSKFKENGYNSIAIISKTQEESHEINKKLSERGIIVRDITDSNTEYEGGICTIPSYLSKGLEFDSVIIADASESKYNSNKSIDMKLLYVSMTRPLHELKVLYSDEISEPLAESAKSKVKMR